MEALFPGVNPFGIFRSRGDESQVGDSRIADEVTHSWDVCANSLSLDTVSKNPPTLSLYSDSATASTRILSKS